MPDDKLEVSQRISSFLAQGMNSQARAEVENFLREWPGDAEVFTLAGDVYAWTGAPSTAYRHYNSAADTYNRLGMPDKMLSVHHKILELDATLLDANTQVRIRLLGLLVAAESALASGRYEQAVTSYQEAIRQFPNHTVTYQRLAALFTRLGRPAEAVTQYLTVARAFHQHGVLAKAAPYFERVLEIEPANIEALNALLAHLTKEGRAADSERPIKSALQEFLERGENEEANSWFKRLPESSQQDVTPLRAALLLQTGDLQQAEDAVKMLDMNRVEISEWFKRMGRSALDRGDSVTADTYFRWASPPEPEPEPIRTAPAAPQAIPVAPANVAPPAPPLLAPAPPPQPVFVSAVAVPAMPVAPPAPPVIPPFAPPPPPVAVASPADSTGVGAKGEDDRVVLQTMGEMCLAEDMFEEARQVFERLLRAEPNRKVYLELLNKARLGLGLNPVTGPPPPLGAVPAPPVVKQGMTSLTPAQAATALGMAAFTAPPSPPPITPAPTPAVLAPPPRAVPAPQPIMAAPPTPMAAPTPAPILAPPPPPMAVPAPPPVLATPPPPMAVPAPAPVLAPPPTAVPAPAPVSASPPTPMAVPTPAPALVPPPIIVAAPVPSPAPATAPPSMPVAAPRQAPPRPPVAAVPAKGVVQERRIPALSGAGNATSSGAKILRTAHSLQLGELPPSTPTNVDYDDDIIE